MTTEDSGGVAGPAAREPQVAQAVPFMEFRSFDPSQFAAFDEPGYGKVATSFLVIPYGTARSLRAEHGK